MKRKLFIIICIACCSIAIEAQTARDEIKANINRAGSNHMAYPGPQKKLSPAPKGKTAFYISHYGRHGSRYLCGKNEYIAPMAIFQKADSADALTELGKDVKRRLEILNEEAKDRYGELTLLGAQQHRQIAERMYNRFPEVFADSANIDAKSTIVIRCILSMENALQQLIAMNPKLKINHDASAHDMYYMNYNDRLLSGHQWTKATMEEINKFRKKKVNPARLMSALFKDMDYVENNINVQSLMSSLFSIATIVQNCESRHQLTLMDIFTFDEIYGLWEVQNANWYMGFSHGKFNGGNTPYIQRNLLRRIIFEADSCLQLDKPGATLRYGHETMVLPLTCLMELNDAHAVIDNLDELSSRWINYHIYPMATNIQLIFYRANPTDKDVLVKVLLCEDEATLPIKTDCAPYYHWKDVREYYLNKLDNFDKNIKPTIKHNNEKNSFWDSSSLSKRK